MHMYSDEMININYYSNSEVFLRISST